MRKLWKSEICQSGQAFSGLEDSRILWKSLPAKMWISTPCLSPVSLLLEISWANRRQSEIHNFFNIRFPQGKTWKRDQNDFFPYFSTILDTAALHTGFSPRRLAFSEMPPQAFSKF